MTSTGQNGEEMSAIAHIGVGCPEWFQLKQPLRGETISNKKL